MTLLVFFSQTKNNVQQAWSAFVRSPDSWVPRWAFYRSPVKSVCSSPALASDPLLSFRPKIEERRDRVPNVPIRKAISDAYTTSTAPERAMLCMVWLCLSGEGVLRAEGTGNQKNQR